MTWQATAPSVKFHPIEDKCSKTISMNGLAATDLLHSLTRSDSSLYDVLKGGEGLSNTTAVNFVHVMGSHIVRAWKAHYL